MKVAWLDILMRFFTVWGAAIASLLLSSSVALAQTAAEIPPDATCYIEWEDGTRVSLEDLCSESNSTADGTSADAGRENSPNGRATAGSSTPSVRTSAVTVEIVSNLGSAVYVNGVPVSGRSLPQPSASFNGDADSRYDSPRYFNRSNRRYIRHQRFYPYQ